MTISGPLLLHLFNELNRPMEIYVQLTLTSNDYNNCNNLGYSFVIITICFEGMCIYLDSNSKNEMYGAIKPSFM